MRRKHKYVAPIPKRRSVEELESDFKESMQQKIKAVKEIEENIIVTIRRDGLSAAIDNFYTLKAIYVADIYAGILKSAEDAPLGAVLDEKIELVKQRLLDNDYINSSEIDTSGYRREADAAVYSILTTFRKKLKDTLMGL
jgi:hypothetical protein